MNKELELWQFAAARLRRDEAVMLLIVAESSGSSPGRQGFKMIVAADDLCGSIGGGVMETKIVHSAKRIVHSAKAEVQGSKFKVQSSKFEIRNPKSEIVEMVHRRNAPDSSGMICSGRQTIISFKLDSSYFETVQKIIDSLQTRESCRLQVSNSDLQIIENREGNFYFERTGENQFVYEENLEFKNKLFIIGGGHCALALSELMSKMDFYITLLDDREELNTLAKNKFAHRKTIIDSYENIGEFVEAGSNVYVVVMTLGYKFDEIVIRKLFDKSFKYFGVLGSRAKMKTLLRNLTKEGFDKEKLSRIYTPIGLKISSRTPEEIAVSIAAEIIMVKNKR